MTNKVYRGMPEAYVDLRDQILQRGQVVAPRGESTWEIRHASFTILDAVNRGVPVGCGRKVGVKMQAIDGTGNLSGTSYPDVAIALAPVMDRFADTLPTLHELNNRWGDGMASLRVHQRANMPPGGRFLQGAYGPRIGDQLLTVERQLRRDPSTRQAVVILWDPITDTDPSWADRPCTTSLQFMIRPHFRTGAPSLEVFVEMRANDLWTGTCYDVWQFGQVQAALAHVLGVETGAYHHHATSLHIYERDLEKFKEVQPWYHERIEVPDLSTEEPDFVRGMYVPAVDNPRESFGPLWRALERGPKVYSSMLDVQAAFGMMLNARRHELDFKPTNTVEDWYWTVLTTGRAPE